MQSVAVVAVAALFVLAEESKAVGVGEKSEVAVIAFFVLDAIAKAPAIELPDTTEGVKVVVVVAAGVVFALVVKTRGWQREREVAVVFVVVEQARRSVASALVVTGQVVAVVVAAAVFVLAVITKLVLATAVVVSVLLSA